MGAWIRGLEQRGGGRVDRMRYNSESIGLGLDTMCRRIMRQAAEFLDSCVELT